MKKAFKTKPPQDTHKTPEKEVKKVGLPPKTNRDGLLTGVGADIIRPNNSRNTARRSEAMSTIDYQTVCCSVCGEESRQGTITSYSTFGAPDMDFRPPSMYRETMRFWAQECPHCGYANTSLDMPCPLPQDMLKRAYVDIIMPNYIAVDWSKRFAKMGAMRARTGNYADAAIEFLQVAWTFDDLRDDLRSSSWATEWRLLAICQAKTHIAVAQAESLSLKPCTVDSAFFSIYADMLRRVGDFQAVLALEDDVHMYMHYNLIDYQKRLAEKGDAAVHKQDETDSRTM